MSRSIVKPLFRPLPTNTVNPTRLISSSSTHNTAQQSPALLLATHNGHHSSPGHRPTTAPSNNHHHHSSLNRHPTIPIPNSSTRHHQTRPFISTPHLSRDHHFDTLKFVQRLESEGLTPEQSRALMSVLSDVIEESIQNLTRTMVLREDSQKTQYTQKVDFSALRTELLSLDSSEASLTRASHERLTNEIQKLSQRLRDETQRTQSSVRLDLNLEKGRTREEASAQELRIKETETRIEQEVSGLRERVEGVKFDTLRWLAGVSTGTAALLLGAWRLFM